MKVSRKKFVSGIALSICLFMLIGVVLSSQKTRVGGVSIIIGFIAISLIALTNIVRDARVISINKFNWYFQFIFMGLAPMCNYISRYYPWGVFISDKDIASAQLLVILFDFVFIIVYNHKNNIELKEVENISQNIATERIYVKGFSIISILISVIAFGVLVKLIGNISNLFFRAENQLEFVSSTISFTIRKYLSALPAMLCVVIILLNKKISRFWNMIVIAILGAITLMSNFPTSTSRYWMGTIFLGLLFVTFIKKKESRIVDYIILGVMLVGFPLFYFFKFATHDITNIFSSGLEYNGLTESFNSIDFDAFTLVARSIRYVRENGITYGEQLINVIFFFIPRSIWKTKPIPTNVLVAAATGNQFTNLSCPLPAEGYVNFGVLGTVIYACTVASLSRFLDRTYWEKSADDKVNLINSIYPFICVISMYINRGPLQPSFIQTIALLLPLFTINLLFSKKVGSKGVYSTIKR